MRTDKLFHQERSTAESRVEFEARFYRELAEKTPGLMCCHDWDGVLLWINPAAAQSLGYTEDEVLGSRLDTFLSPPVRFLFPFYLERMRRKRSDNGLMRVQAKRGDERIWMYRSAVSEGPELRACVLGHAMDATDQVQAETALRGLFHNIPVGQMEFDLDGNLRRINPAACKLLGHSELELLCRTD
ncbi:MAG: PAS domain S-box protein, partial [Acidobacteriaceae bacterium]|nr:PAS domain S-box protein [Acidobacteriaceae bacterium]